MGHHDWASDRGGDSAWLATSGDPAASCERSTTRALVLARGRGFRRQLQAPVEGEVFSAVALINVLGLVDPVLEMVKGQSQNRQRSREVTVDLEFIDVMGDEFVRGEKNV